MLRAAAATCSRVTARTASAYRSGVMPMPLMAAVE